MALIPEDRVSYARFLTHFTPPPGSVLRPLNDVYFQFSKKEGRQESLNCNRLLLSISGKSNEEEACHAWGLGSGKPDYMGYNQSIVSLVEALHVANDIEKVVFQISLRAEAGNEAHCDLKMIVAEGAVRDDMNRMRSIVSNLFEKVYVAYQQPS